MTPLVTPGIKNGSGRGGDPGGGGEGGEGVTRAGKEWRSCGVLG